MDIASVNNLMRKQKCGAQMFLHNLTGFWARNRKQVKAGIYRFRARELQFIRPGYSMKHIKNKNEFLLTDGVLQKKSHYSPNRRLCRIITKRRVLYKDKKTLTPWARRIAEAVHESFGLKKVRFVRMIRLFNPDYLAKG